MEPQLAMLMQVLDRLRMSSQVRLLVVTATMHQAPVLRVNVQGARTTPIFLQIQSTADGMRMLVWLWIFSGSCRLSKACRKLGLRALPIDKDPKRAESCAVANYDLSDPQQYSTLVEVLHAERESI